MYENAVNTLDDENKTIVNGWIEDIENAKNVIQRGQKSNQLEWFCKQKSTSVYTRKPAKSTKPIFSVISKLSQKLSTVQC